MALSDWLACAVGGAGEPAAVAARGAGEGLLDRIAAAGTAGHVLDFDDTFLPGVAHLSAATAPAAVVLGAEVGATVGEVLCAYADGFEAMGAMARAAHPALYDGGWHPTAVCGSLGASVAAARLLGLDDEAERSAAALALLRAAGLRAAFGSAGKSIHVGLAAATGVAAARLAASGARLDLERVAGGPAGFGEVFGAQVGAAIGEGRRGAAAGEGRRGAAAEQGDAVIRGGGEAIEDGGGTNASGAAIEQNWIKAYPCCLQTHGAIEAALAAAEAGVGPAKAGEEGVEVVVHPLSLQAAAITRPRDGLEAKFSIPYLTAVALIDGAPTLASFASVGPDALALSEAVSVRADSALLESEAALRVGTTEVARVEAASGSPQRPMDAAGLAAKQEDLAGESLIGHLESPARPAQELVAILSQARVSE